VKEGQDRTGQSAVFSPNAASLHYYPVTVLSGARVGVAGYVLLLSSLGYCFENHGSEFHSVDQIAIVWCGTEERRGEEENR
jgi:hypothetical protein